MKIFSLLLCSIFIFGACNYSMKKGPIAGGNGKAGGRDGGTAVGSGGKSGNVAGTGGSASGPSSVVVTDQNILITWEFVKEKSLNSCFGCHTSAAKTAIVTKEDVKKKKVAILASLDKSGESRMPQDEDPLDQCQRDILNAWLKAEDEGKVAKITEAKACIEVNKNSGGPVPVEKGETGPVQVGETVKGSTVSSESSGSQISRRSEISSGDNPNQQRKNKMDSTDFSKLPLDLDSLFSTIIEPSCSKCHSRTTLMTKISNTQMWRPSRVRVSCADIKEGKERRFFKYVGMESPIMVGYLDGPWKLRSSLQSKSAQEPFTSEEIMQIKKVFRAGGSELSNAIDLIERDELANLKSLLPKSHTLMSSTTEPSLREVVIALLEEKSVMPGSPLSQEKLDYIVRWIENRGPIIGNIENNSAQKTIFVDQSNQMQKYLQTGRSWSQAFSHLQDALAIAQEGQQIWVAIGEYFPDQGNCEKENDSNASFVIRDGVSIYGGFKGGRNGETSLDQRDPANKDGTVLSGLLNPRGGIIGFLSGSTQEKIVSPVLVQVFNHNKVTSLDSLVLTGAQKNLILTKNSTLNLSNISLSFPHLIKGIAIWNEESVITIENSVKLIKTNSSYPVNPVGFPPIWNVKPDLYPIYGSATFVGFSNRMQNLAQ